MHIVSVPPQIIFQALSDETRLRIVRLLADSNEESCLCEITESLAEPEYKVSRHLKVLRQSGILSAQKEGRWVYHQIIRGNKSLDLLIGSIKAIPDSSKIFSLDQKRFQKRILQRDGNRCSSAPVAALKVHKKVK